MVLSVGHFPDIWIEGLINWILTTEVRVSKTIYLSTRLILTGRSPHIESETKHLLQCHYNPICYMVRDVFQFEHSCVSTWTPGCANLPSNQTAVKQIFCRKTTKHFTTFSSKAQNTQITVAILLVNCCMNYQNIC